MVSSAVSSEPQTAGAKIRVSARKKRRTFCITVSSTHNKVRLKWIVLNSFGMEQHFLLSRYYQKRSVLSIVIRKFVQNRRTLR